MVRAFRQAQGMQARMSAVRQGVLQAGSGRMRTGNEAPGRSRPAGPTCTSGTRFHPLSTRPCRSGWSVRMPESMWHTLTSCRPVLAFQARGEATAAWCHCTLNSESLGCQFTGTR